MSMVRLGIPVDPDVDTTSARSSGRSASVTGGSTGGGEPAAYGSSGGPDPSRTAARGPTAARSAGPKGRGIGCNRMRYAGSEVPREGGPVGVALLQEGVAAFDGLVTAVQELGRRTGAATPFTDALLGLSRLQARVRGLY